MKQKSQIVTAKTTVQPSMHDILAARIASIAEGYQCAFFLHGPGGHGKSHAVRTALTRLLPGKGTWRFHAGYITARRLVDELAWHPDSIHVFEDMEELLHDRRACSLLRAACGSVAGKERIVAYETAKDVIRFSFTGGIIILSNEDLSEHGIMGAVASRFVPMNWRLNDDAMVSAMRAIAAKGFTSGRVKLTPAQCSEVAEHIISKMGDPLYSAELRTLCEKGFPTYQQWLDKQTGGIAWQTMLDAVMLRKVTYTSRRERIESQQPLAATIYKECSNTKERIARWKQETGLSHESFYQRIKEAKAAGLMATGKKPKVSLGQALASLDFTM